MEVHIRVILNIFLCFQWNSCPNRQTSSLNGTIYCVEAICDWYVVLWVVCWAMYWSYNVSPSGRWRLPIPVTCFCKGSPSGQCYLCLFCSPRGQCRTGSPSRGCLFAGHRRLGMTLRKWLLQCLVDCPFHFCHPVLLFFNDCRCQMYHPCLDGVHQALLQLGPNWCHSYPDITNGRWARWWRRPSVILADHEIGHSAWGCPCPCPTLASWRRDCRFLLWHFVVLRLGPRFLPAGYLGHALEQVRML